jgi:hypothetical protein
MDLTRLAEWREYHDTGGVLDARDRLLEEGDGS